MKLVFGAEREAYSIENVCNPITVGDLKWLLEEFDDDDEIIISHDRGYTFGTLCNADIDDDELYCDDATTICAL